jgi:hypothetical protein
METTFLKSDMQNISFEWPEDMVDGIIAIFVKLIERWKKLLYENVEKISLETITTTLEHGGSERKMSNVILLSWWQWCQI